jgi:hypothetical protein
MPMNALWIKCLRMMQTMMIMTKSTTRQWTGDRGEVLVYLQYYGEIGVVVSSILCRLFISLLCRLYPSSFDHIK